MKNFKPGQKVVFKYGDLYKNENGNFPKENEIVTILKKCDQFVLNWDIVEYKKAKDGKLQSFNECVLFPLEEIAKEETEKILADLEIKFIPERDLILN